MNNLIANTTSSKRRVSAGEALTPRSAGRLCLLSVVLGFFSGCATTTEPTGFLRDSGTLRAGQRLDQVYTAPGFTPRHYSTVGVAVESPLMVAPRGLSIENLTAYLSREVVAHLQQTGLFSTVVPSSVQPPGAPGLRCELAITQLDPGSRALRWWFGEFGAGHAIVQVEGRCLDAQTTTLMLAFVEQRRGAAIFDITGGNSQSLIEEDLRNIAHDFSQQLLSPGGGGP